MAKQIVAATRINHNGEIIEAGSTIDPGKFTKDQLTRLHERGAIVISVEETPEKKPRTTTPKVDDKKPEDDSNKKPE